MYQSKSKLRLQLEARMELLVNQCCDVNDFYCDARGGTSASQLSVTPGYSRNSTY